jgi:hypothetical protein
MQTFICDLCVSKSFEYLDSRRLGKQRVEAIQIARCLLIKPNRWSNHPAVKMWRGYESFLVKVYLYHCLRAWESRGFNNTKCKEHFKQLISIVGDEIPNRPYWLDNDFVQAHRSNLVRKYPGYYRQFWPDVPNDLPYTWPV